MKKLLLSLPFILSSIAAITYANDPFCDIIHNKASAVVIDHGDEYAMAIEKPKLANGQFRPGINCLIISKIHILALDMSNPLHQKIHASMENLEAKLSALLVHPGRYTTLINLPGRGQTVPHLHMHVTSPNNAWKNPAWRS